MIAPLHGRLSTLAQLISSVTAAAVIVILNCSAKASQPSPTATDSLLPVVYLTRAMSDRIDCPAKAKPPTTLIVWSRRKRVLDTTSTERLNVDELGALVINNVTADDAGLYTCTQYSPLKKRHPNFNLSVVVKGMLHLFFSCCLSFISFLPFAVCLFARSS